MVFIKEIVPRPAITLVANTIFHENYTTLPMRYLWKNEAEAQHISYEWKKKGKWNNIEVKASLQGAALVKGSEEEFITEHFWGYTSIGKDKTAAYEVAHPRWDIYPVNSFVIDCDFESVYGKEFAFLQAQRPASVFLAEGSAISVFSKTIL